VRLIPPGRPGRNGYVEAFNSGIRDEYLNIIRIARLALSGISGIPSETLTSFWTYSLSVRLW
jgi:hypothetical protein